MSEDRVDEYGYNIRNELISAAKNAKGAKVLEYQYQYDDIGNRITSLDIGTNRTYAANNLNQYTSISNSASSALSAGEFIPQFDDDGNQTLIQTATGIWQVQYNGENRPVVWQCVSTNSLTPNSSTPNSATPPLISMSYDRMGRRVTKNNQRFAYNGYLQIADSFGNIYIWDPLENVATRPLVWMRDISVEYYTHDGNKNVSEIIAADGSIAAHYEYAPFGEVAVQRGEFVALNIWRFASEFADDETMTIYFNYRHFVSAMGRWLNRDPMEELGGVSLYLYGGNEPLNGIDIRGMALWDVVIGDVLKKIEAAISAIEVAESCMNTIRTAFARRDSNNYSDKLNHCMSSCEIANDCSQTIADALGSIKEARDLFVGAVEWTLSWFIPKSWEEIVHEKIQGGSFQDSVDDFVANFSGFDCRNAEEGCECCCRKKYPK